MPIAATSPLRKRPSRKSRRRCRRCESARAATRSVHRFVGRFPSQGPVETFKLANLNLPIDLPVSLPSQFIEQRPDVRAAEEQLHSASAQIGVATANMLPAFTISANGGYINTALAGLIAPQNLFWSRRQCDADGFRWRHVVAPARGRKDTYNAAAWTYRGTVIGAVQNVADALRALQNDADALRAARDFERAAKISFDLARQQMQTGTPMCCCCSPRNRPICRQSSRWCRRKRRGFPIQRRYFRRSAAAGGTGLRRRRRKFSTSARARQPLWLVPLVRKSRSVSANGSQATE